MRRNDLAISASRASPDLDPADEDTGFDHGALDRQHELLTKAFQRFADLIHHREQRNEAIDALRGLIARVGLHFGFEESLMTKSGFPDYAHHFQQHLGMMTELGVVLDHLENKTDLGVARQVDLLIAWYQQHAAVSDYKFFLWMAR